MAAELIITVLGCTVIYVGAICYFQQQRIKQLEEEKKIAQARNEYLLEKLVPVLRKPTEVAPITAHDIVESKKHSISVIPGGAACACGEKFYSDDPGKLQEKIEEHHKQFLFTPVRLTPRKSWSRLRDRLENQEKETK